MPTIHVQLEEKDFVDAATAASALTRASLAALALTFLIILVGLAWLGSAGYWRESFVGAFVVTGAAIGSWVGRGLSIAAKAKRLFRQQKRLQQPYELSWTAEAITLTAEHGTSTIPWPDFHKRRETDAQVLLFLSDANVLMVPKRAFRDTSLLDQFRDLVTERIADR